jgi:hypothetical protein
MADWAVIWISVRFSRKAEMIPSRTLLLFLSEILLNIPSVGCRIYDAAHRVINRARQITNQQ